ncbi:MAG TPA: S8 family serine peptidase, partial [Chthonomonadaceae bacterium]|nr:S8 family serine peptidase [Chthonomonadaceae bacterium]
MNARAYLRCFVLLFLLVLIAGGQAVFAQGGSPHPALNAAAGEIVVGFHPAAQDAQIADDINSVGAIADVQPRIGAFRLKLRPGLSVPQAIQSLSGHAEIAYAEPNYMYSVSSTPNDTYYANQYALPLTQTDHAWDIWNPSATVVIAIVDTGVQTNHPDLVNKIYKDSTGTIVGYNTILNNTNFQDDNSHGTHCAGIAAAQVNNGTGIAGVAGWTGSGSDTTYIKIMPVKCMDASGSGTLVNVANAIVWATDHGANVISLSLGAPSSATTLTNATDYAWSHGCLVVAAAGNSSLNTPFYPAADTNVLSVASTDNTDTLSSFSNYGTWVKIAAPGSNIFSTLPGSTYGYKSGTSMATPFVAGVAALVWAQAPNLTNQQLNDLLVTSVDPYTPYTGHTIANGAGRINVYQALQSASAPSSPVLSRVTINPNAIYGGSTATGTVTLTAAAPMGGAIIALSSADTNVATVPDTVTIAAGSTSATFTITGGDVTATTKVTITGTYNNLNKFASLTVSPLLASLSVAPNSVKGGVSSTGTITLNGAAPSGGVSIALSSSDSSATVPSSVTIAAGAKSAAFHITTTAVSADVHVTITASYAGVNATAPLAVLAPALMSLTLNPTIVADGASSTGTVTLDSPAPTGGMSVTLA